MSGVFSYLEVCLEQIVKDNELGALQQVCNVLCSATCLMSKSCRPSCAYLSRCQTDLLSSPSMHYDASRCGSLLSCKPHSAHLSYLPAQPHGIVSCCCWWPVYSALPARPQQSLHLPVYP